MTANVVEQTARPSRLDQHITAMTGDEPTICDVSAALHLLGTTDDVDGVRIQALCLLASRALGKFSADVRSAPPVALNEVVRDARQSCGAAHIGCLNHVHAWIYDGTFCSPTCRAEHMRSQGERWAD
jgi:hypothetical protein